MQSLVCKKMESRKNILPFLAFALILLNFPVSQSQEYEECVHTNPSLTSDYERLPQSHSGVQAILPFYRFQCKGRIGQFLIQVVGENTRFDVQLWRPMRQMVYSLKWSATFVSNGSTTFERLNSMSGFEGSVLMYTSQSGIPVSKGDVLGYYIEHSDNPIQLAYINTSTTANAPHSVIYKLENVDAPLCNISLCDSGLKAISKAAPLIYTSLMSAESDDDSLSNTETSPLTCTQRDINSCDIYDPIDDSSPGNSTTNLSIPTSTTSSVPSPTPHPIPPASSTPDHPTSHTGGINDVTTTTSAGSDGISSSSTQDSSVSSAEEVGKPAGKQFVVDIDPLVIGFTAVGGCLFITLIVLVFVLIFCLCRKRKPSSKTRRRRLTDAESVDSRVTTSTHLAASSSVENSNSSNPATTSHQSPNRAVTNGVAVNGHTHTYANTDVTREGHFSPFSPLYENRNKGVNGHMRASSVHGAGGHGVGCEASPNRRFAVRRSRNRGWSTGALQQRNVIFASENPDSVKTSQALPPRARSHSPKLNHLISEPSMPAPSPPPRSRSNGEIAIAGQQKAPKRILNRYSAIETPSDYGHRDELPRRPKSHSVHVHCAMNKCIHRKAWETVEEGDEFESHDYADPDYPSDEEHDCLLEPRYDRLVAAQSSPKDPYEDVDIYPEEFVDDTTPPPLPPKSTGNTIYQDPEKSTSSSREDIPLPSIHYGYVPTAEQRRMLLLQNGGHYEISDGVQTTSIDGYDHLTYFQEVDTYWAPAATTFDLYEQLSANKYRELPRTQIKIMKRIGSGHFGTVSKGLWYCGEEPKEVAVKTVKTTTEQERIKLLQEAAIMGQFAHNNVVRLHGVVTVGEPVLIVLEYMTRGDLRSFLQKLHPRMSKRELPDVLPKLFIKFSKDIAGGMSYLSKKNFIHRDLAARNILLSQDLTCKIGDFGMARDIEGESDYYRSHGGIIPVKWTAPEALNYNKYSSASDIWSYGMVLFEIWSLGEKPFNDLTNPIVIALVSSKHCQPPPPGCPRPIYHLMIECWNPDHNRRPNFDSIHDYLDSPEESLLQWQEADIIAGKHAHMLGAPLTEANDLYLDLQRTYQKPPPFSSKI